MHTYKKKKTGINHQNSPHEKKQKIYRIPCNGTFMSGVQHELWVFTESNF